MAMREGHIAAAAPAALMYGWSAMEAEPNTGAGLIAGVSAAVAVMSVCTAPDWDHPRYEGRMHFFAALSRAYARACYRIRLSGDHKRGPRRDLHRGPTHCLETALLAGLVVFGLMAVSEWTRPHALLIGLGVAIGWADHILLDALTPSGVPVSATYNALVHREVWRRHTVSRRWKTVPMGRYVGAVMPRKTMVDGRRVKLIPVPCVLPGDERAPDSCDKGWFKTDKGAEHAIVIPGLYALTVVLGLARAGLVGAVLTALTGVGV